MLIIGVLVIGAVAWWYTSSRNGSPAGGQKTTITPPAGSATAALSPTPTPTIVPIVTGKETYTIQQNTEGPKVTQVVLDPQLPNQGGKQAVTLTAKHSGPIREIVFTVTTEQGSQPIALTRTGGTDSDGVWTGEWTLNQKVDYTYYYDIKATGADGKTSTATITLRRR